MSEADLLCEATGCQLYIFDKCDDCKSSFCDVCIHSHNCGEFKISGNKRDLNTESYMEVDILPEVAGMTISKCRASVLPQNASDLIFLHDSWLVAEECEAELKRKMINRYN